MVLAPFYLRLLSCDFFRPSQKKSQWKGTKTHNILSFFLKRFANADVTKNEYYTWSTWFQVHLVPGVSWSLKTKRQTIVVFTGGRCVKKSEYNFLIFHFWPRHSKTKQIKKGKMKENWGSWSRLWNFRPSSIMVQNTKNDKYYFLNLFLDGAG